MANTHSKPAAFTLVELLVALTITMLMLGLISQIFTEVTNIVGTGIATSKNIANSRTIGEQVASDAERMAPPAATNGGFIVILNQQITDATESNRPGIRTSTGNVMRRAVRSDQLVFIRDNRAGGPQLTPLCPANTGAFAPSATTTADYVRIWYGHVRRTETDGRDLYLSYLDESTIPAGEELGDALASNWILGRQAMFLAGGTTGNLGGAIHANTADARGYLPSPGAGYGAAGTPGHPTYLMNAGISNHLELFMGITDVADQELDDGAGGGVVGFLASGYPATAYVYSFGYKRLRANPLPYFNPSAPYEYAYASWQIAQMHPIFMENVSDFIVEFAGDYEDNLTLAPGPDGQIDTDPNGNIKWYGYWFNTPFPLPNGIRRSPADGSIINFDGNFPVIYLPVGGVGTNAFNDTSLPDSPYYDDAATLNTHPTHSYAAFVWRHDDNGPYVDAANRGSRWPYLIRIRYRLHDPNGK